MAKGKLFEPIQTARIYENVVRQIKKAILNKTLKPGDKLPPEKELAEKFGVSKASIREAFRVLEAMGFLEIKQGISGGAFVKEVDLRTARENFLNYIFFQKPSIKEFTEFRLIIEPQVVEFAIRRLKEEGKENFKKELKKISTVLETTKENLKGGQFFYELDINFHRLIATLTRNRLVVFIVDAMHNALINIKKLLMPDMDFCQWVYSSHMKIFEAICDLDVERAKLEMEKHIKDVSSRLELITKGTIFEYVSFEEE